MSWQIRHSSADTKRFWKIMRGISAAVISESTNLSIRNTLSNLIEMVDEGRVKVVDLDVEHRMAQKRASRLLKKSISDGQH